MTTFLFAANLHHAEPEVLLASAADITKHLMPSLGVEMVESRTLLPEIRGGWVLLAPASEQPAALFSSLVNDRHAVLVFGDVRAQPGLTAAQAVHRAWVSGGATAVRQLQGCFAAVLVDRTVSEVVLLTDLVGHRYLRYYADGEALLVSPHDLFITATGRCPVAIDRDSAASILALDWSLQARSLLKPLQTCRATEVVRWAQGKASRLNEPLLHPSQRIAEGDRRATAAQLERIIEVMQDDAASFVGSRQEVEADLTAGADTRAVLGLLLSVADGSRIHAICHGEEDSLDVRTARRLACRAGVRFSARVPQPPSAQTFFAHCDLRAFYMNGDTSGKRAYHPLPVYTHNPVPRACGRGGSVVKGFYRTMALNKGRPVASFEDAVGFLGSQMCGRLRLLPWAESRPAQEGLFARLRQACESYSSEPMSGGELFDLFYLYERHGVWEAMNHRLPWLRRYWSPFTNTQVARLGFGLPAAERAASRIHQMLVRRHLPAGYWMRVNEHKLLALEGDGDIRRWLRQADRAWRAGRDGLRRRLNPQAAAQPSRSVEQLCAAAFAGPLAQPIQELLQAEDGIGRQLFGERPLQALLDQHRRGESNFVEAIGSLVTIERWWRLLLQAKRLAAAQAMNGSQRA